MAVTLYTSRVVLNHLGDVKYGIWNLIAGIVILFSFVQNSMATAIQRYLNYHLGRQELAETKSVFYNSKTIHYYLSFLFFLICEVVGLPIVIYFLNVPDEYKTATLILFQIVIINSILLIIRIPYQSWIIAQEKMSFFSLTSIIEGCFNLLIVFLLPFIPGESLINYGILTLTISLILNSWFSLYCQKIWKLKILHCEYSKTYFQKLLSFSSFTLLGSFSNVAASQGVNLLMNFFFGVLANAAMGIAQQINGAIIKFVSNFQTAFKPQIVKLYSSERNTELNNLIFNSSRISFFLMWILACPILINTDCIIKFWLGRVPTYTADLSRLMIICSLLECISSPLWMAIQATGKIKAYQVVISITNLSIPLWTIVAFIIWRHIYAALIVKLIVDFLVLLERFYFSNRLYNFNYKLFFHDVIKKMFLISAFSLFISLFIHSFINKESDFFILLVESFLYIFICISCILCLGLHKRELVTIKNKIYDYRPNNRNSYK